MKRHPDSVSHQYSASYEWRDAAGTMRIGHWSQLCSGADQALRRPHAHIQRGQETDSERKVVRPKLRFDEYKVLKLEIVFRGERSDERGQVFRQAVEIPRGANPDLRHHKHAAAPTAEFEFVKSLPGKSERPAETPVFID